MKRRLLEHVTTQSKGMYADASKVVNKNLGNMTKKMAYKLTHAAKGPQDKPYKDLKQIINSANFVQNGAKQAVRIEFQAAVMEELLLLDNACARELENPGAQLKAANPFSNTTLNADDLMDFEDENDDDGSDAESEFEDEDQDGV